MSSADGTPPRARLDALLAARVTSSDDFDVAGLLADGLEAVPLETLRAYLAQRLSETRGEVRLIVCVGCVLVGDVGCACPFALSTVACAWHSNNRSQCRATHKLALPHLSPPAQLVTAINADYGQFVALSQRLSGADAALARLKGPLADVESAVNAAAAAIAARREAAAARAASTSAAEAIAAALAAYGAAAADVSRGALLAEQSAQAAVASEGTAVAVAPAGGLAAGGGVAPPALLQLQRSAAVLRRARSGCDTASRLVEVAAAASSAVVQATGSGSRTPAAATHLGTLRESLRLLAGDLRRAEDAAATPLLAVLRRALHRLPVSSSAAGAAGAIDAAPATGAASSPSRTIALALSGLSDVGRAADATDACADVLARPLFTALFAPGAVDDGVRGSMRAFGRACDAAAAAITDPRGPIRVLADAAVSVWF